MFAPVRAGACLDENSIVAFFESRLEPDAVARVDQHAAGCEACRRVLAAYGGMAATASHRTEPQPVSGVTSRESGAEHGAARAGDLGRLVAHAHAARRVGTVLSSKWRIDGIIGMGGMAQVFAATHRNGRRVAVKMMRPELAIEPSLVARFLREGYVANKIEHAGAVAVLDDDVAEDGAPFLVMELLRGRTLRARLEEDGPLPVREALLFADQILDVLAAAHEHGIVHRDVKPENLFETEDGTLKVLDFGIARLREEAFARTQTQTGTTVGTLGYMSPEQARGRTSEVDPRSDVWAMGATLFTLLSARSLQEAETTNEALLLAMTVPVPPMATLLPALPLSVSALLDAALRFDKNERFADAREMQKALRDLRRSLESSAVLVPVAKAAPPRDPATRRGKRWVKAVVAATLGLVVAAALAMHGSSKGSAPPPGVSEPAPATAPPPAETATAAIVATAAASPPAPSASVVAASRPPAAPPVRPRAKAELKAPPAAMHSGPSPTAAEPPAAPAAAAAPARDPLAPRR